jgi:hypothetical protein
MFRATRAPAQTPEFEHQPTAVGLALWRKPRYLWAFSSIERVIFSARVQFHSSSRRRANRNALAAPPNKKAWWIMCPSTLCGQPKQQRPMRHGPHGLQRGQPNQKGRIVLADRARRRDAAVLKGRRGRIIRLSESKTEVRFASLRAMAISIIAMAIRISSAEGSMRSTLEGSCSSRSAPRRSGRTSLPVETAAALVLVASWWPPPSHCCRPMRSATCRSTSPGLERPADT